MEIKTCEVTLCEVALRTFLFPENVLPIAKSTHVSSALEVGEVNGHTHREGKTYIT